MLYNSSEGIQNYFDPSCAKQFIVIIPIPKDKPGYNKQKYLNTNTN